MKTIYHYLVPHPTLEGKKAIIVDKMTAERHCQKHNCTYEPVEVIINFAYSFTTQEPQF